MDIEICLRCNFPYEDIYCKPICSDCEQINKTTNSDKLLVA